MPNDTDLTAVAQALDIPWRRILEQEIRAEREIRRCLGELDREMPMWRILAALPLSLLDSWRVRERIGLLLWAARTDSTRRARGELKAIAHHFLGKRAEQGPTENLLARHFEFAYRRILELHKAARAAETTRGDRASRLRALENAGCRRADGEWAVDRALAPRPRGVIDDAVRRAREEGFEIPRSETEFRAWVLLRRYVRRGGRAKSRGALEKKGRGEMKKAARPADSSHGGSVAPEANSLSAV